MFFSFFSSFRCVTFSFCSMALSFPFEFLAYGAVFFSRDCSVEEIGLFVLRRLNLRHLRIFLFSFHRAMHCVLPLILFFFLRALGFPCLCLHIHAFLCRVAICPFLVLGPLESKTHFTFSPPQSPAEQLFPNVGQVGFDGIFPPFSSLHERRASGKRS